MHWACGGIFEDEASFLNAPRHRESVIPSQEPLDNWWPIEVLLSLLGLQDSEFDPNKLKDAHICQGIFEVEVSLAPNMIQLLAKRKHYGLNHHVTSTIHATLSRVWQLKCLYQRKIEKCGIKFRCYLKQNLND